MNRKMILTLIALPVIAVLVTATVFASGDKKMFGAGGDSPLRSNAANTVADAVKVQNSFQQVYEMNKDRVVFISTEKTVKVQQNPFFNDPFFREFFGGRTPQGSPQQQKRTGLGTGFVISADGYIATNHHVVAGMDKVQVKIDKQTYDAKVVGSDERTDIALIKIEPKGKIEPVYFGDSDKVAVGDWAIAIGNPFGLDRTYTVGIVSAAARRDLDFMGDSRTHIQTDASINPGNSGGPLLNIYGEVIGINRMIYSQSGGNVGIGFAIPINTAKEVLRELKDKGKVRRGYIGVQMVPFTEEYAAELGLKEPKGALIGQVMEGSPAAKAGVQVGDVVLKVGDTEVTGVGELIAAVEKTPIGKSMKVEIWRNKSRMNLFITVQERP